eukprot:8178875-Pyramimonas_sp.AAC.1
MPRIPRPLGDHRRVRCFPLPNPFPQGPVRLIWRRGRPSGRSSLGEPGPSRAPFGGARQLLGRHDGPKGP